MRPLVFPLPIYPNLCDGKTLLISSRWARKVTVVDIETRKILRQIPVGRSPHGIYTLDHVGRQ